MPFAEPDRIVVFWGSVPQMGITVLNYPDAAYVYYRTRSQTLEHVSAYDSYTTTLTGAGEPERLNAAPRPGRGAKARSPGTDERGELKSYNFSLVGGTFGAASR